MVKMCVIKSIITEKGSLANKRNCYLFLVDALVNKIEVKKDIESKFNVKVKSVNLCSYLTKAKKQYLRGGGSSMRKIRSYKKAYVFLGEGSQLNFDQLV